MFLALKFWMLIKFDFSSKTGILFAKFAFATANLKIETLRMRRRFVRVLARGPQRSNECTCLSHARAIEHVNDDNKTCFEREAQGNPEMEH